VLSLVGGREMNKSPKKKKKKTNLLVGMPGGLRGNLIVFPTIIPYEIFVGGGTT